MSLTPGTRIGGYEVVALIGAGGMGDVYRARDTKLHRDVAIKVLPDRFVGDPERLARFERESRTLATLNHPHIAQVYAVEDLPPNRLRQTDDGAPKLHAGIEGGSHENARASVALVMEFVDGEDLSQRLARTGPIPVDEATRAAPPVDRPLHRTQSEIAPARHRRSPHRARGTGGR